MRSSWLQSWHTFIAGLVYVGVIAALILGTGGCAFIPASPGSTASPASNTFQAVCIPAHDQEHPTWSGRATILKGVVRGDPTHEFLYAWDAGDGSPPEQGTVTDPYAVAATHVYSHTAPGQVIEATLTVTDATAHEVSNCVYPLEVHNETQEIQVNAAIDDGLWFLHTRMQRESQNGVDSGFWDETYPVATTGAAVLAFEVQGHQADGNPSADPYVETVQRGLNYLLDQMQSQPINPQPAGDPDTNSNGQGLYARSQDRTIMYEVGIVTMALAGSNTPEATAAGHNPAVTGRSYRDIAQDLVDFMAWAQADANCGSARGGWRYEANGCDADMSVSQWPVLGMQAVENNWQVHVPDWVKTELHDNFLTYTQGGDGGFGYEGPGEGNVARTAAGLVGLAFTGVPASSSSVQQATDFIAHNWSTDNIGNFYAMYGVMKASKLTTPEIKHYGDHDWYAEYADYLVAQQSADGSWNDPAYANGNLTLSTSWAILILSPTVFAAPLALPHLPWWPLLLIPLLLLLGIGFLWLRKQQSPKQEQGRIPPTYQGAQTTQEDRESSALTTDEPEAQGKDVTSGKRGGAQKTGDTGAQSVTSGRKPKISRPKPKKEQSPTSRRKGWKNKPKPRRPDRKPKTPRKR